MRKNIRRNLLLTAGAVFCLFHFAVPAGANPLTEPAAMQDTGMDIIFVQDGHTDVKGGDRKHHKKREGLSPEDREELKKEFDAERQRIREELKDLPPEERAVRKRELKREFIKKRIEKHLESLPPEEREAVRKEMEERRARIKAELESLPPDQRRARMEELRREFRQKHKEHWQERREKFQERWRNATPEQKKDFCDKAAERCAAEEHKKACDMIQARCRQFQEE